MYLDGLNYWFHLVMFDTSTDNSVLSTDCTVLRILHAQDQGHTRKESDGGGRGGVVPNYRL